jgi:hypothetical protein
VKLNSNKRLRQRQPEQKKQKKLKQIVKCEPNVKNEKPS